MTFEPVSVEEQPYQRSRGLVTALDLGENAEKVCRGRRWVDRLKA
jgi:hypothetical protein